MINLPFNEKLYNTLFVEQAQIANDFFTTIYPDYCRECDGTGFYVHLSEWGKEFEPCPSCVEHSTCPQCNSSMPNKYHCRKCGWDDSKVIYGNGLPYPYLSKYPY